MLQLLLMSKEYPFPSLVEVSKRVNRSTSYLRKNFPNYSKQISSNYYKDREQMKFNRIQQKCEEVRQAVLSLHSEGIYPSNVRVASALKHPGNLRIPEVYEAWRNTLNDLNIRRPRN